MALYRCNRCGHLSEQNDSLAGTTLVCPSCGEQNQIYPTVAFVRTLLERYFTDRRELRKLREELTALRALALEGAHSQEPVSAYHSLPMDFDPGNTDHFCSKVQTAPVAEWFRQRHITIDFDPRTLETSEHYDAVSTLIGQHYAQHQDILERIRQAQKQDYSFINLDLSRRDPHEAQELHAFCKALHQHGFLAKYLSQEGDQVVRLSLDKTAEVRRFFEGGWLVWFSFMRCLRHLVSQGLEFSVARDISIAWPKDDGHLIDIFVLTGQGTTLCLQCRTGDPTPYMERLVHLRDKVGFDPDRYLLCTCDLTEVQAVALGQRFGVPVATPHTLSAMLAERLVASR